MDSRKKAAIVVAALALIGVAVYWFTRPLTPRQLALIGMRACENGDARTLYRFAPQAEKKAYGLTEEKVRGLLGLLALRPAPDKPDKYLITDQPGTGGCSVGKWLTVNNGQPVLFEIQADLRRGHRAELHLPITNLLTLYMVVNGETPGVKDKHQKIVNGLRKIAPQLERLGFSGMLQDDGSLLAWRDLESFHQRRAELYEERRRAWASQQGGVPMRAP